METRKYLDALSDLCGVDYSYMRGDSAVDAILELINISRDAVSVVRCKDCRYWNNGDCYRIELTSAEDFCSYGKTKGV